MFDFAWVRGILHVTEWSGLSIGATAALAALAWYVPLLRKVAIEAAFAVGIGYVALMHGNAVGRADVQAQWDAAKAAAKKARADRDAEIQRDMDARYKPIVAGLEKRAAEFKDRADTYERTILPKLAKSQRSNKAASGCELGADALRLRHDAARSRR